MSQAHEVAVIVKLVFPDKRRPEYEFDVPVSREDLPQQFWRETDDHLRAIYRRVGATLNYEFEAEMSRREAVNAGIPIL